MPKIIFGGLVFVVSLLFGFVGAMGAVDNHCRQHGELVGLECGFPED